MTGSLRRTTRPAAGIALSASAMWVFTVGCTLLSGQPDADLRSSISTLATQSALQATQLARQATLISHLATRGPGVRPQATSLAPTPYLPVTGDVQIERGVCCKSGGADELLLISADLSASSPFGEITRMRVRFGGLPFEEEALAETEWQDFEAELVFTLKVPLNWSQHFVSVQYQDEAGNLSPVYHDEIAVEGLP